MSSVTMNEEMKSFGSTFPKVEFNASMVITELLSKTLENSAKELASRCIKECALRHGFDATEEIRLLGLENLSLIKKQMAKKSGPKAEKKSKPKGEKKQKEKISIPLPFNPNTVDLNKCQGLTYNRGLFTQCAKEQMENSVYCKGCQAECDGSASGIPTCGTVQQRLACGLYEFKDTKGRSPIRYTKVLEKAKLTETQAQDEAGKLSIVINPEHFAIVEKKKSKGRPKKAVGTVEAADVTDLFAKLTAADETEEIVEELESEPTAKAKKTKLTEEEKDAKRAALQLERELKKKERENKLAAERAEREAKRKAEMDAKKAAKEQEQKEKDAKKAAKEAEKAAKEAKKETKKAAKETKTVVAVVPPSPAIDPSTEPPKVRVRMIKIEGVEYLKSSTNILYNPKTREEIGIYDKETNSIKPLPEEDSDEEEEEEYEDYDN